MGQRLLWLLDHYRGAGGTLNCPLLARLYGPLDAAAVHRAFSDVVRRHESLRTIFRGRGRHLTQVIRGSHGVEVNQVDLSTAVDPENRLRQVIAEEVRTRIDPTRQPIRVTLWRMGPEDHVLCVNMHHLVTDVWSNVVIFRELVSFLNSKSPGESGPDAPVWQYRQFADWQSRAFDNRDMDEHRDYWERQLAGIRLAELPRRSDSEESERRTGVESATIGWDASRALRELARSNRTTVFSAMLSIFYVLLHRTTGQTDLAVASLFANRTRREVQNTVGFLANLAILRTRLPSAMAFSEILRSTHSTVVEAFSHQAVPYQVLQPIQTDGSRAGDVVFQLVAETVRTDGRDGINAEVLVSESLSSRFDFELALIPGKDGFRAFLFYDERYFRTEFVREFLSNYVTLASALATDPSVPLMAVPLVGRP
jgi:hypothetical protein